MFSLDFLKWLSRYFALIIEDPSHYNQNATVYMRLLYKCLC